jgi:hypothetical protein
MRLYIDKSTGSAVPAGAPIQSANAGYVRLEIRRDTLFSLINNRALVIEDLRGLDRQAKIWIKQRLLETLLPQQSDVGYRLSALQDLELTGLQRATPSPGKVT